MAERQSARMSKITNDSWHRMLYSCTNMATVVVKRVNALYFMILVKRMNINSACLQYSALAVRACFF